MFKWKKIGVNKSGQLKPKLSVSMILGYVCLFVAILAMAFSIWNESSKSSKICNKHACRTKD